MPRSSRRAVTGARSPCSCTVAWVGLPADDETNDGTSKIKRPRTAKKILFIRLTSRRWLIAEIVAHHKFATGDLMFVKFTIVNLLLWERFIQICRRQTKNHEGIVTRVCRYYTFRFRCLRAGARTSRDPA